MFMAIEKLKNQKIVIVFAVAFSMFVDAMSYGIVVPLLPIYSDKVLTLSNVAISFFAATYAIGLLLCVPFVNLISKKIGNKNALIFGGLLLLLSSTMFPFGNSYEILLIARFLQGASAAITWTCGLSLVAQSVHPQHRSTALATAMVGVSVGHLIGAPFAGFLYQIGGLYFPFFGVVFFGIISLILILSLPKENEIFKEKSSYKNLDFIKLTSNNKILTALSGIVLLESFMLSFLEPSLSLYASRHFNASSETIGLLFGTQVLALGIFSPITAKIADKYGKIKIIPIGIFASGIIFIMMSYSQQLSTYFILMGALGAACAFSVSPVLSAFADEIDKSEMKGLYHIAYGFLNLIYSVGMIIGPSAGFIMNELWSTQTSYIIIGILLIISVPLFILYVLPKKQVSGNSQLCSINLPHPSESQKDKSQDFSAVS
jgi:MFS family permease